MTISSNEEDQNSAPGVAYIDGRYCPISEAKISLLDWGFLRSDATYDVVHVWQGRFFRLDKHIDRFLTSVKKLRMTIPFERDELTDILHECVRRSGLDVAYVEMLCTRGMPRNGSRHPRDGDNRFVAFAIPFSWILPPERREQGLNLGISRQAFRIPPTSVDPTIKNYHWGDFVTAMFEGEEQGVDIVVLTDIEGRLCEGPGFNIFLIKDGALATPAQGVLEGITRQTVFDLCAELRLPVTTEHLTEIDLQQADEIFVCSTAGGIMSVTRLESVPVADSRPGSITRRLTDLYWAKHDDPAWSTPVK